MMYVQQCRTTTKVRLDADDYGEPAIVIGDCKLVGPLIEQVLDEAVHRFQLHKLGAVIDPTWRDRRDDTRTTCEGSKERVYALPGITEAWCSTCQTHVPTIVARPGVTLIEEHTRRVEARPA